MSLEHGGTDTTTGLDYIIQTLDDGTKEVRWLATTPTPDDHVMMASPDLETATGIKPLSRAELMSRIQTINYLYPEVPVLDQDGQGACTAYAHAKAVMFVRAAAGASFILLSANWLYTEINGGRDAGSNAGDACKVLQTIGIAPAELVPGRPLRPAGVSQDAIKAAGRFKLRGYLKLNTIEEVWTAIAMGWPVTIDVRAGAFYKTDGDGTIAYGGRATNHEQVLFGGLRPSPSKSNEIEFKLYNSWGQSWGIGAGDGWAQEAHVNGSQEIYVPQYMLEDTQDNIPVIV